MERQTASSAGRVGLRQDLDRRYHRLSWEGLHRWPCAFVAVVLDNPAAVRVPDEIVISYRPVSDGTILAALCYAVEPAKELDE